jgi:ribosomal protein S18 acetylase RimI-like enzyme
MRIRKYIEGDLDCILEVALRAFSPIYESFQRILGEDIFRLVYPNWRASQNEYIQSLAEGEESERIYVVVGDNHAVIGFIHFSMDLEKQSGEIGINCVDPDYQGQGTGKRMYRFVINIMKENGIRCIVVGTGGDDSHIPARKAYEDCGFKQLPLAKYCMSLEPVAGGDG